MEKKREMFNKIVKLRPCAVCDAQSTGYHFGVLTCEACKVRISAWEKKKKQCTIMWWVLPENRPVQGSKQGCTYPIMVEMLSGILHVQRSFCLKDGRISGYFDIK